MNKLSIFLELALNRREMREIKGGSTTCTPAHWFVKVNGVEMANFMTKKAAVKYAHSKELGFTERSWNFDPGNC